jgi:hypothetical protein
MMPGHFFIEIGLDKQNTNAAIRNLRSVIMKKRGHQRVKKTESNVPREHIDCTFEPYHLIITVQAGHEGRALYFDGALAHVGNIGQLEGYILNHSSYSMASLGL